MDTPSRSFFNRSRAASLALKISLALAAPCLFLFAVEMVLRLATTGSLYLFEKNPHYLAESGRVSLRPSQKTWWYGCHFDVNADSFRMEHEVRDEKRTRILALGDSVTLGIGVRRTRELWPNRLEAMANERFGGGRREIEVLNTGVQGWNLLRQDAEGRLESAEFAPFLDEALERYDPDAVVYCICLNDVPSRVIDLFHIDNSQNKRQFTFFPESWREQMKRKAFYRMARDEYRQQRFSELDFSEIQTPPRDAAYWARVSHEVGELRRLAEEADCKFYCVIVPFSYQVLPQHEDLLELNAKWQGILSEHGIPWVDITPHFNEENVLDYYVRGDYIHPNAKGHALIAEEVMGMMEEQIASLVQRASSISAVEKTAEPAVAVQDAAVAR